MEFKLNTLNKLCRLMDKYASNKGYNFSLDGMIKHIIE